MMRHEHRHRRSSDCTCKVFFALEPDDNCPVHACGEWPPRCEVCGQYMPWPVILKDEFTGVIDLNALNS